MPSFWSDTWSASESFANSGVAPTGHPTLEQVKSQDLDIMQNKSTNGKTEIKWNGANQT
jgi:hypothetical protein